MGLTADIKVTKREKYLLLLFVTDQLNHMAQDTAISVSNRRFAKQILTPLNGKEGAVRNKVKCPALGIRTRGKNKY
jgi:hypothetical protein